MALAAASVGKGGQGYYVEVFNLRTDRRLHDAPAGQLDRDGVAGRGPVTTLVLGRTGDVAWIEATSDVAAPPAPYEVWSVIGRGGVPADWLGAPPPCGCAARR